MLASTDYNINHPLRGNQIDLNKHLYENLKDTIDPLPIYGREEFNLIKVKDPNTIYYVEEKPHQIVRYLGDVPIDSKWENFKVSNKYCIMLNDKNEYCIYRIEFSKRFDSPFNLVFLCRYKNAQDAINKLSELRKIGSVEELNRELYYLLISHFKKNINIQDAIFGIMILYGYSDHVSFQPTINLVNHYKNYLDDLDKYCVFIHDLVYDIRGNIPSLIKIYYRLLQVWVKYDYFKAKKYDIHNLDDIILSDEINDIIEVMREI